MRDEMKKVPRLRFRGFSEEWEQCKAEELCKISTGKGNTQDKVENGKYPFYVRSENIERSNYFLYDQEAVLTVGDGVGTGRVFHYVSGKYNLHQRVYRMYDFNKQISAKYFYYYFSLSFHRRVRSLTAKTSVDSVRLNMIADMEIKYPSELEQLKIFSFLDYLIKSITLHQRKLEQLKELKKAYLQLMFPKKDETLPRVRFADFEGEWEQCKLKNLFLKGGSGGTPTSSNSDYYNGDIPFLSISDITKSNGYIYTTEKCISLEGLKNSSAWIVPKESISLAMYASVGKVAILKLDIATSQAFYNMIFEDINTRNYIYHYLIKKEVFNEWITLISTGTQANLNADKVKNTFVLIPSNNEQKKIAELLRCIEVSIDIQQKKIHILKSLKKSYLQNMFI